MARLDEQLVQVQCARRIAGRERDDTGDLPVGPGRDPHIEGSDVFWGDPESGGHQRHKLRIVAPHRLRAETETKLTVPSRSSSTEVHHRALT